MDASLASYAAHLAPQIDRLFIAGHRAASRHVLHLQERMGPSGFGVLIDLRRLLLRPEGTTVAEGCSIERYVDPGSVVAVLSRHESDGWLERDCTHFRATPSGQELLAELTKTLARGVDEIWAAHAEQTRHAVLLAALVVDAAAFRLPAAEYPAFAAKYADVVPIASSPAFTLWSHLDTLRYLRADAHALAWASAGLDRLSIQCLTVTCHMDGQLRVKEVAGRIPAPEQNVERALDSLASRGWASVLDGEWRVAAAGRQARDQIEERTDQHNAPPFGVLTSGDRARFADTLAALPETGENQYVSQTR